MNSISTTCCVCSKETIHIVQKIYKKFLDLVAMSLKMVDILNCAFFGHFVSKLRMGFPISFSLWYCNFVSAKEQYYFFSYSPSYFIIPGFPFFNRCDIKPIPMFYILHKTQQAECILNEITIFGADNIAPNILISLSN